MYLKNKKYIIKRNKQIFKNNLIIREEGVFDTTSISK